MRRILLIIVTVLFVFSCKNAEDKDVSMDGNDQVTQGTEYTSFGEEISMDGALSYEMAAEKYKAMKPGDTVTMKFKSKANSVCQKKGCWMKVAMGDDEVMVTFKDYGFFMPKNLAESDLNEVVMNGKAFVSEMSVEDQKHYAEDAGKTQEEIDAITEIKRTLSFEADGVLVRM
jgi:hypothetical protein